MIPYSNAEWEKLSILLNLLIPKLPAPREEDLAKGILEAIDMDSYRVEKKAAMKIALADKDAEIEPVPTDAPGHKPEPELDRLSNILKMFNEQFGTLFTDSDRVAKRTPVSVHLHVVNPDGSPVIKAKVSAIDPLTPIWFTGATADDNGDATIALYDGRTYSLEADTSGYREPNCAGPVKFTAKEGLQLGTLTLDKTIATCRALQHSK